MRRAFDRVVGLIARGLAAGFFRRVEVSGIEHRSGDGPTLLVANHFNGFVDPVVLTAALGHLPRFLAKASLAGFAPARLALAAAGVVLVQRPEDRAGTAGNVDAFAACHEALARGRTVALFPEGTTHDQARMVELRTGAARIALGARAAGVAGLRIVPVGLHFDDKLALRSRVLVRFGAPLRLDEVAGGLGIPDGADDTDHEAVRRLTNAIEGALRDTAPDFESVFEAGVLQQAAAIAERSAVLPDPPLARRQGVAARIGRADLDRRHRVQRALADYVLALDLARLRDEQVIRIGRAREVARSALTVAVALVLLAPVVVTGIAVNALPVGLVVASSLGVRTPVTKGTVRVLVSLLAFPAAWFFAAFVLVDDASSRLLLAAGYALAGFIALVALEHLVRLLRLLTAWHVGAERAALLAPLADTRARVVDAVHEALDPGALDSQTRTEDAAARSADRRSAP